MALKYVDSIVLAVHKDRLNDYRKMARKFDKIWIEHGALEVHECLADDVKPGKRTSFPQAVKAKPDEVVGFAWIVFNSRKHRDAVNKKVMADPRIVNMDPKSMPFDGKRMFWGGFKEFLDLRAPG